MGARCTPLTLLSKRCRTMNTSMQATRSWENPIVFLTSLSRLDTLLLCGRVAGQIIQQGVGNGSKVKSFRAIVVQFEKASDASQLSPSVVIRITHAIHGQQIINGSLRANKKAGMYDFQECLLWGNIQPHAYPLVHRRQSVGISSELAFKRIKSWFIVLIKFFISVLSDPSIKFIENRRKFPTCNHSM